MKTIKESLLLKRNLHSSYKLNWVVMIETKKIAISKTPIAIRKIRLNYNVETPFLTIRDRIFPVTLPKSNVSRLMSLSGG